MNKSESLTPEEEIGSQQPIWNINQYPLSNIILQSNLISILMAHHQYGGSQTPYRSTSQNRSHPTEQKVTNLQRAAQEVKYHQPFQRLQRRLHFQKTFQQYYMQQSELLVNDNFALFDAVIKRGGYHQVCADNRWDEINLCLQYQKKQWNLNRYYFDVVLPHESKLVELLEWPAQQPHYRYQVLELHLLPCNNLTNSYYHLIPAEYMFAQSNFFSMDEYFNLKTIALLQPQVSKLSVEYADKFMMLRKKLLLTGQIRQFLPKELAGLCIVPNPENRVIIVGVSLPTLMLADKLSLFGLSVTLIDKSRKDIRYRSQHQIVQNGLIMLQGGKQQGSYYNQLQTIGIEMLEMGTYSVLIDEEGRPVPEEKVRLTQEHFMGLVNQLREEIMNKKKFYEELMTRLSRRSKTMLMAGLEHEKGMIKWHYDRYLLVNRIKGEQTTVGDLVAYQNTKFAKHITQPYSLIILKNFNKLYERLLARKTVSIISQGIESTSNINGQWVLKLKNESITAKHLIYADQQSAYRNILQNNFRLDDIGSDVMGDSVSILQQLTGMKYINCVYAFKDKVALKDSLSGLSSFTLNFIHGYVYFFLLEGGREILATLRCYPNTAINYYAQIYTLLESKCLIKGNRLAGEEDWSFEYSFSLKDEKYMESLIRIKQNEKMYLMLPITSVVFPQRMQSLIELVNYIATLILQDSYPQYALYDPKLKDAFMHHSSGSSCSKDPQPTATKVDRQKQRHNDQECRKLQIQHVNTVHAPHKNSKVVVVNKSPMDLSAQPPQEIIVANLSSHLLPEDSFGLQTTMIRKYEHYIKNKIDLSSRIRDGLFDCWKLAIDRQVLLSDHLYLFSLGQPYHKSKLWYKCFLEKNEQQEWVFPLHKFITRRQHYSLQGLQHLTIYYQTVLVINEEVYFCIIDEDHPDDLYYHKDMNLLIKKFNETFSKLKEQQGNEEPVNLTRARIQSYPPPNLLSERIINIIEREISERAEGVSQDKVLEEKLQKTYSLRKQNFMKGNISEGYLQAKIKQVNLKQNIIDINFIADQVLNEVNGYLKLLLKTVELKERFTLFDLFFGILDEQHLCSQIMRKMDRSPIDYSQIQRLDPQLCQQIKQTFSKNIPNNFFSIFILPVPGQISTHRNFMHRERVNDFEQYTYILDFSKNSKQRFFIFGNEKLEFQEKEKQEVMRHIVKSLALKHSSYNIIWNFQQLLNKEVEKEKNLTPRLKAYYRMTKREVQKITPASMARLQERCKDLDQKEKSIMAELLKKKKIMWVDNDFVFILK